MPGHEQSSNTHIEDQPSSDHTEKGRLEMRKVLGMLTNYLKLEAMETEFSPWGVKILAKQSPEKSVSSLQETS